MKLLVVTSALVIMICSSVSAETIWWNGDYSLGGVASEYRTNSDPATQMPTEAIIAILYDNFTITNPTYIDEIYGHFLIDEQYSVSGPPGLKTWYNSAFWEIRQGIEIDNLGTLIGGGLSSATRTKISDAETNYGNYEIRLDLQNTLPRRILLDPGEYFLAISPSSILEGNYGQWGFHVAITDGTNAIGLTPEGSYLHTDYFNSLLPNETIGFEREARYLEGLEFAYGIDGSEYLPIPEPSSFVLLLIGLISLGLMVEKHSKKT